MVAIVVLGSGLIRGKVPPLLASRLYRGRRLYDRFEAVRPLLVSRKPRRFGGAEWKGRSG